jgi:UDP-2-acetamido-2,6-beta-L-arabino-hexul-4-ose reductase
MRIAVTGADGFLGWHTRCTLKAGGVDDVVAIGRSVASEPTRLDQALAGVDAVLHLAGVNRADAETLRVDNLSSAQQLTASIDRLGAQPIVVYADSIQSGNHTPFGDGKLAAADHLTRWGQKAGITVTDVRFPNLFGEHGRPHYNSVVATFCHALARGEEPVILDDRLVPLLHVQDAVDAMIAVVGHPVSGIIEPDGRPTQVSALLEQLRRFRDLYATGDIPDVLDPFDRALFNTYRSFCFPDHFPIHPRLRSDVRGDLFECVRGHRGQAQVFCSSTNPGRTRGEHFHLRKIERFLVLRGTGQIALRRLFDDTVVRFDVSGARPAIIDMPTMWAHSITNTGHDELMTLFWADELLEAGRTDTYSEPVELATIAI